MSEIDEALAHLRHEQMDLAIARSLFGGSMPGKYARQRLRYYERKVLAALSWLWDAQERADDQKAYEWVSTFYGELEYLRSRTSEVGQRGGRLSERRPAGASEVA